MSDTSGAVRIDRLWLVKQIVRFLLLVGAGATLAGGCGGGEPSALAGADERDVPLPTIGIDTELGVFTGVADVGEIDVGEIESVVMIGDSITVGSQSIIEEQFSTLGFEASSVVAQNGKRTAASFGDNSSGADIAAFIADGDNRGDEQLWVFALGTNDISQYSSSDDVATQIRSVLDQIPADAPVVWINTYFADRPDDTAIVNAAIDQTLADRGNAIVGRWDEIAGTDGVLRSDGVHPNADGAKIFAAFVTSTVAEFLSS